MEKKDLKLSVIIPLYNKADSIYRTIKSVLTQSFTDFELIIVNDGSTDHSRNVVTQIQDPRIKLINQDNKGVSAARNRGAKEAEGEWLMFLDADDIIYPESIRNLFILKDKLPEAIIYCGNYITYYNEQKEIEACNLDSSGYINDPFKYRWFKMWNIRLGSFIMKKDYFDVVNGFDQTLTKGEDVLFTDSLQNFTIAYTSQIIMKYDREQSDWSNRKSPIEKNISWHLRPTNENYYKRLLDAEIIGKDILRNILKPNISSVKLLQKNWKNLITIIFALSYRTWLNIYPKNQIS